MISERKFIFRRTMLDIPLLVFLGSQIISTLLSIDPLTSRLGYYSRFNGGLASTVSYLLLYWAFVSNISKKGAKKLVNLTLWSGVIVSAYGVLEHFGIDKDIWQQDVQSRVFSTLGQPNWLAAWIVALTPITWAQITKQKENKVGLKSVIPYFLSTLFFTVLLFTGSRSGLLGFGVAEIIFWGLVFFKYKFKYIKEFLVSNIILVIMAVLFGTQLTPSIFNVVARSQNSQPETITQTGGTALETGGTESGIIRKIVWQGAVEIWKHYPIFGTGVETFAYSYYQYRPAAHNLTSEWDYIYNKAHNEYLNFMANTGTVGILAYLVVVGFAVCQIIKMYKPQEDSKQPKGHNLEIALLAGYSSILVTNFFGFSVVPIQLLFYLYPAFAIIFVSTDLAEKEDRTSLSPNQKILGWIVAIGGLGVIFTICRYWYADYLYATGTNYGKVGKQDMAILYLNRAIKLAPGQSVYFGELARAYTNLALAYNNQEGGTETASQLAEAAIESSIKAVNLSPANVNLKRVEFGVFVMLSALNPNYLLNARDILIPAVTQAPTDAKLSYNLGLIYSRIGQNDLAVSELRKTIELKPNYKEARLAYAILLIDAQKNLEAKEELNYILTNIDPADSMTKQYLESIK